MSAGVRSAGVGSTGVSAVGTNDPPLAAAAVDSQVAERTKLSRELASLARGRKVNAAVVK
ncbi:unnamed protein product, partial [marine sediment metagenome]